MRVYLLSVHDEGGAEDMSGTADPDLLPDLMLRYFLPEEGQVMPCCGVNHLDWARERLAKAKVENFAGGKYELGRHWGGPQLHVVDLA